MFEKLKSNWKSLERGKPGSRFQDQYDRQRKAQSSRTGRVLRILGGAVLLLLGLFFLPAPGPGFIIVALGGALLARELKVAAIVLDWLELRGRALFSWAKRRWQRLVKARRAVVR